MIRAVLLAAALATPAIAAPPDLTLEMAALTSWLGGPIGALPMTHEAPRVIVAMSRANQALALGEPSAALDALPEAATSCELAGALRSLEIDLLTLNGESGVTDARAALLAA